MIKYRILVNASTLVVGGGIQIGVSFVEEALSHHEFDFIFVVSKGIFNNLAPELKANNKIICLNESPSRPYSGRKSRKKIKQIEKAFDPHLVYSLGFPSYIRFKAVEIGRYTNVWEVNPPPLPWHTIRGIQNKLKTLLSIYYRRMWAGRADYIETQTEAAKIGITTRIHYPVDRIKVIPNSPNAYFIEEGRKLIDDGLYENKENMVFCLSAPYRHKNLDLIPHVAAYLKNRLPHPPVFMLTLPPESEIWKEISATAKKLKISELVQNSGVLQLKECMDFYKRAKVVFLPTLLEIFSATYLEAMAMKVPIVTTDLYFAHDNCKEAALYFQPRSFEDAADKIATLIEDKRLYNQHIRDGVRVLGRYPGKKEKYDVLFKWFKDIIMETSTKKG